MLSNSLIARKDGILKWHTLTAMRYLMLGQFPLTADASAISKACKQMLDRIWLPPKDSVVYFRDAIRLVRSIKITSEQDLRAKPFTEQLIAAAANELRARKTKAKKSK